YPPGIPIAVPGEILTEEVVGYLKNLAARGTKIYSTLGGWPATIKVVKKQD
ncbi:MAG: arginine decarboxylase, partial [Firmicutes bacterium]|nr:arginine decarboxylase [Bacillota bacterium]